MGGERKNMTVEIEKLLMHIAENVYEKKYNYLDEEFSSMQKEIEAFANLLETGNKFSEGSFIAGVIWGLKGLSKKLKHIDDIENEIDVICKETKINENLEMMKSLKEIYENGDTKKDKIRKKFDKDSDFELFLQLAEKYGLIKKCIYKGEEYYYLGSTGHHILNRGYRN